MQEKLFREWLENIDNRPPRQISDQISRVKRIERAGFDIDHEYEGNCCNQLLTAILV